MSSFNKIASGTADYYDCLVAAKKVLADFADFKSNGLSPADQNDMFKLAIRSIKKKKFYEFRQAANSCSAIAMFCVEAFIFLRSQRQVFEYLSIQESANEDSQLNALEELVGIYSKSLREERKKGPTFFGMLNPFKSLAQIRILSAKNKSSQIKISALALIFNAKCLAIKLLISLYLRSHINKKFLSKNISKNIIYHLTITYSVIFRISPQDDRVDFEKLVIYTVKLFGNAIFDLSQSARKEFLHENSAVKFLKILVGTMIGFSQTDIQKIEQPTEFIKSAVKSSIAWALTYPLIDDVLDNPSTSQDEKKVLQDSLQTIFSDDQYDFDDCARYPSTAMITRFLLEAIATLPDSHRSKFKNNCLLLLHAHKVDSEKSLGNSASIGSADELIENSMIKAALIRIATAQFCQIELTDRDVKNYLAVGLLNQLGDDIWDEAEDFDAGRVTPVTAYRARSLGDHPIVLYADYGCYISKISDDKFNLVLAIACIETIRNAANYSSTLVSSKQMDRLFGPDARSVALKYGYSVDPDEILFLFGTAIKPVVKNFWEKYQY